MHFFESKHNSNTIVELAQISLNLPEKNKIKTWPPKEKKHVCTLILGAILKNQSTYSDFANVFTNFAKISTDIARILSDFVRIFPKSNVFGGAVEPPAHPPPTSMTLTEPLKLTEPHYITRFAEPLLKSTDLHFQVLWLTTLF